jgi:hypothetical protein
MSENIENTTRQPSSVAPGRAQVAQQCAVITGHEGKSIQFSPLLFARKSCRYLDEFVLDSNPSDFVIDSTFDRDSVVAFIAACEGADFSLTLECI